MYMEMEKLIVIEELLKTMDFSLEPYTILVDRHIK